jgi:hypothetical protein
MTSFRISRREMITGGAAATLAALSGTPRTWAAAAPLTVQHVIDCMNQHIVGPWREGLGVDRIVAGSADAEVIGIGSAHRHDEDSGGRVRQDNARVRPRRHWPPQQPRSQ